MTPNLNAAYQLVGKELDEGWLVTKISEKPGGAFSVCYLVEKKNGEVGFLKAFDVAAVLKSDDPMLELQRIASHYNAEKDLLQLCKDRKLSKIVRVLCEGKIEIPEASPSTVLYLIFELAHCDAREIITELDPGEQLSMLRLSHHVAVAIEQLHSAGAAHQDLKPANLLIWKSDTGPNGKVGDLGSAYLGNRPAPQDKDPIPGDSHFASPEQLYGSFDYLPENQRRYATDFFMLGNLISFLLVKASYSSILFSKLHPSPHWQMFTGTFEEILPSLIDVHVQVMEIMEQLLHVAFATELINVLNSLCHPDPMQRGNGELRRRGQNPFQMHSYVSVLNRIHRGAAISIPLAP